MEGRQYDLHSETQFWGELDGILAGGEGGDVDGLVRDYVAFAAAFRGMKIKP
jgi:hypothetical protein